ncbi:hypothetical protein KP509_25G042100 [Ceratopteris richardii]|uniref:Pentatricopeptide repeat-containing protein n=1 Tax=Ceratopteris richardii TaxID=49495 RepID=A0A8T2RPR4_CERRI|nr:hypothetical protein KP509_25G042100 [Ceratopteris richardii]
MIHGRALSSAPNTYTWNKLISSNVKNGDNRKALDVFYGMLHDRNTEVDKVTFLSVLKSCSTIRSVLHGQLIHGQILEFGLETDLSLGNALIDMYAKCGSFDDANCILDQIPKKDVISWGALISGYACHGMGLPALETLQRIYGDDTEPNRVIFLSCLKACAWTDLLHLGNVIHQHTVEYALDLDITIGNTLIDMYTTMGCFHDALKVFDCLHSKSVVSWGAMISGYSKHGLGHMSLQLFHEMQDKGTLPNTVIVSCVLRACGVMVALDHGKHIHSKFYTGEERNPDISNGLIDMYMRCHCPKDAHKVFDEMPIRNVALYESVVHGYIQCGEMHIIIELFNNMHEEDITPGKSTLLRTVEACSTLAEGQNVHYHIVLFEADSDMSICSALVLMYSKYGSVSEARDIFNSSSSHDLVAWGAMTRVYVEHDLGLDALKLIKIMEEQNVEPNVPIFLSALKACLSLRDTKEGRKFHDKIIRSGLEIDAKVGSSLIDMYAKCGSLIEARTVFQSLKVRDLVSWSCLLSGYAYHGFSECAMDLFVGLLQKGFEPDKSTILSVLKACSSIRDIVCCRLIHFLATCLSIETDVVAGSSILDFYAKCISIEDAKDVFNSLSKHYSAPWNAMISGHLQCNDPVSALQLLSSMQGKRLGLEKVMVLSLMEACGSTGASKHARFIHDLIISSGLESDIVFGNALVDMYAKCGDIQEALKVFNGLCSRDLVSWGTVLAALTRQGLFERAWNCVQQMEATGLNLTEVIHTNILSACSHGGYLSDGAAYLKSFKQDQTPLSSLEHFSGAVDLFSRAGQLDKAKDILHSMPMLPDHLGWTSLLSNSKTYGHVVKGNWSFEQALQQNPFNAAGHMPMSQIYIDAGVRGHIDIVKEDQVRTGLPKEPGKAWIEVDGKLQEFTAGKISHAHACDGSMELGKLLGSMRKRGYVPQTAQVFETLNNGNGERTSIEFNQNESLNLSMYDSYIHSLAVRLAKRLDFMLAFLCVHTMHHLWWQCVCMFAFFSLSLSGTFRTVSFIQRVRELPMIDSLIEHLRLSESGHDRA